MICPEMAEFIYNTIIDRYDTGNTNSEGERCLHVSLMNNQFETFLTDDEIRKIAEAANRIVDELIEINDSGMDAPTFREICDKECEDTYMSIFSIVKKYLMNDKIECIQNEMCEMLKVGGAYAIVKSTPYFIQGIFTVYSACVDKWEQSHIYETNVFYMARCIMRMNSDDIRQ